jgi:hypothetical protein
MTDQSPKIGQGRFGGNGKVAVLSGGIFYRINRIFRMDRILTLRHAQDKLRDRGKINRAKVGRCQWQRTNCKGQIGHRYLFFEKSVVSRIDGPVEKG